MRLFRRDALAGQSFADADEIEQATRITTAQLNARAKPWVWVGLPRCLVASVASFVIVFNERSSS